jgi:hypothetical protein
VKQDASSSTQSRIIETLGNADIKRNVLGLTAISKNLSNICGFYRIALPLSLWGVRL